MGNNCCNSRTWIIIPENSLNVTHGGGSTAASSSCEWFYVSMIHYYLLKTAFSQPQNALLPPGGAHRECVYKTHRAEPIKTLITPILKNINHTNTSESVFKKTGKRSLSKLLYNVNGEKKLYKACVSCI